MVLGFVFSALAAGFVQRQQVEARIDESLAQEIDELRSLAGQGQDPRTGARFATVDALLFEALRRNSPGSNEDFLAVIDGRIPYVPTWRTPFSAEEIPPLVEAVRGGVDAPVIDAVEHAGRTYRYVAAPVEVAGDPRKGVFVSVIDATAEYASHRDTVRAYAAAAGLTLLVVGLIMAAVLYQQLAPLRALTQTAERITEEDLSARIPERGADDLARLSGTMNPMLERLESAFAAQRGLLDDVGHELRTPLTVVRGHLEMMDASDARDVAETQDLCLDELGRMSQLVDELVLLARSARPDFVELRPTDVDDVVTGVLDRVHPLAERDWVLDRRSDAVVLADENRLVQALMQLTSNAVKHTGVGDRIALGAARTDGGVSLWVEDGGTGVPEQDRERTFERFERGSASVGPGSGLGLSIVAAIAEAHGGQARCVETAGGGATFVIDLPDHRSGKEIRS